MEFTTHWDDREARLVNNHQVPHMVRVWLPTSDGASL